MHLDEILMLEPLIEDRNITCKVTGVTYTLATTWKVFIEMPCILNAYCPDPQIRQPRKDGHDLLLYISH
jgi:hypothetical protein